MVVRKFLIFIVLSYSITVNRSYAVNIIDEYKYGQRFDVSEDIIILENIKVNIDNINIVDSVSIANYGHLSGNINIYSGKELRLQNSGSINVSFNLEDNAKLIQVVHTKDDLNNIGINNNYTLLVNNSEALNLSSIISLADGADKIVFQDAVLFFDKNFPKVSEMELVGNIIIGIDSSSNIENTPILSNVSGSGIVHLIADNVNPLYAINSYINNGNLYASLVRETDYYKILKNEKGAFINYLRTEKIDDKLLIKLDSASSMDELENYMNSSVRLNPVNLMDPIRTFNLFEMLDFKPEDSLIKFMPVFMFSDNFYSYGIKTLLNFSLTDEITSSISGYTTNISFSDYINEFYSFVYGGNIRINYDGNLFFADFLSGISFADFDVGTVFADGQIETNPRGFSYYFSTEFGKRFNVSEKVELVPFVNVGMNSISIMNQNDSDVITGIGSDIKVMFGDFDIKYDYTLKFVLLNSGIMSTALRMNVVSPFDGISGDAEVALLYDEYIGDVSYNCKLGISLIF